MSELFFFLASAGAIAGAIAVVSLRNPFYSVLALVCHLICLAALFLLLQAEFVAAAQVVVYAGAVMVLYVFVVAYIGETENAQASRGLRFLGPAIAVVLGISMFIALLGGGLKAIGTEGASIPAGYGSPEQIGELLLTQYLFAFESASFLLLVAAVGAVVLARRRRGLEPEGTVSAPLEIPRPEGTGTMRESVGGGP